MLLRVNECLRRDVVQLKVQPALPEVGLDEHDELLKVAIVGNDEMSQGKVMLKNMTTGEQQLLDLDECYNQIME